MTWFGPFGNVLAQPESSPADPVIDSFTINHGDAMTAIHEVTLQLEVISITDLAQLQARYRNSGEDWIDWESLQLEREWLLPAGDGLKLVDVEVKNLKGDITAASAAIELLVPVESVSLNWSSIMLHPDDASIALTAEVLPEYATNRDVTWTSSNTGVAVVSADGMVTPVGTGHANITVITVDGGYSAICQVEVSEEPQSGEEPSILYGDLTGTGEIDVGDAILLLRSIVELVTLTPAQLQAADVNLDGMVDVGDAIIILRYIVGLVPSLPVSHTPQPPAEDPPGPPVLSSEPPTQRLLNALYQVSPTAQVEVSTLNVRSGPGTGYQVIGSIYLGQRFIIRDEEQTGGSEGLWYRINYNGQAGWIAANYTSVHVILYGLDYWSNPVRLTDAPPGLNPGNYKINSQYRFSLLKNDNLTPTDIYFDFLEQIPYTRMPLERPAPAEITDDYLAQAARRIRPGSPFGDIADSFIEAQKLWGVNAIYLMAHAALESSWGTSVIARDKNNIFGYMAYDSDPYGHAATFRSMEDCVFQVSGFIRRAYLNEAGAYFKGLHLAGMNEFYATDPMWAVKIARAMQSIYSFQDYIAVHKELSQGIVTAESSLNLRSGPGTSHSIITALPRDTEVKIIGSRLVSNLNWVKVSAGANTGWASGEYITLQEGPFAAIYFSDWYKQGNSDKVVNVRSGPGTEHSIVDTLTFGCPVQITAMQPTYDSFEGKWYLWYRVSYPGCADQSWVRGDSVTVKW